MRWLETTSLLHYLITQSLIMSEFIQNNAARLDALNAFARGIITGQNGKMLIDQYQAELNTVTPMEITPVHLTGKINLGTGFLTPEQITLLFNNLPVDITFVDENDEVIYFSGAKYRHENT